MLVDLQFFSTYALLGLILLVQLVHYPSFRHVDERAFVAFHRFHTKAISWIVVPLMLAEMISAVGLSFLDPSPKQWVLLGLTLWNWFSTFAFQVPCHNKLGRSKDAAQIERLIATNWLRTIGWCIKSALLLFG